MQQPRKPTILAAALAFALLLAPAAAADWLVTLQGKLIETEGPWTLDGDDVTYTDLEGVERTLSVQEVDLEGSRETTAMLTGRPYEPTPEAPEPAPAASPAMAADGDEPRITLYLTRWCGYCRKARTLLKELDADFVAKDIEKNREAAREFSAKSGGRGGVPLIDFDGEIVRGYSDRTIRQLVRQLREKYGDA
jgi:glutaredoxin